MKPKPFPISQFLLSALLIFTLLVPAGRAAAVMPAAFTPAGELPPAAPAAQSTVTLDGLLDADYVQIASDPAGDLASPGPADWNGVAWTDLTALYVAADAANLYVYASLPAYTYTISQGQIGLVIETDGAPLSGGPGDPWANAISFNYTTVDGAATAKPLLPDYVIRGNIYSATDNGYAELRAWMGDWNTGSSVNWGGISGSPIGTNIAYAEGEGIEFAIPLADIGSPDPAEVRLQFFTTQSGGGKGAYDTLPSDDQTTAWDDPTTQTQLVSVPLAVDPAGDLAAAMTGVGAVAWTDLTRLHTWADHNSLRLFIPMPDYDPAVSEGQILVALDTKAGGGSADPWGNAITFAYTATHQNLGTNPQLVAETLPDYIIRGNIFGVGANGWTELRTWNGTNWDTGSGTDWGGIGNSGVGAVPGSKVAWQTGVGLHLTIPFADIGVSAGDIVNLQFIATQGGGTKGAFDTLPSDDQATGWDDATTQNFLATYTIPTVPPPGAAQDNNIFWDDLGHDSRAGLFRAPGGPVTTGETVKLRLRAASNDLTSARLRVYNDRTNSQYFLDMTRVADDGTYEWWEATLDVGPVPTVYWYRFIAIDGTAQAYYEDDAARDGGWGQTFASSQDNSWQLTVYDPAFQTPDWVKNAVIYQIFPDRFRDGDLSNITPPGSFFYDEPTGTITRSLQSEWNTPVCDPRAAGPCEGTYSKNFYGGDMQGLFEKLDYLQDLGVTAIYLNPVFESPSNHKYDTTNYMTIDDNFGNQQLFIDVMNGAHARGMHVILDGVFNHTSSDSIYFDRYGHYTQVGACESEASPYRDWYYFSPVAAGTGPCVGDDGTPGGADYEAWFGYDSLPKLRADNPDVRDLIWSSGPGAVGPHWLKWADGWRLDVAGDVDPGLTNAPTNDFWEGFRAAVRDVNPEAYIVGEEWGNATPWLLGDEWDATMNYQYSSAMLSFWRDTTFVDNDHNSGSSAGPLAPITPSQLDARLKNWQERYPPEAYYAMMNLLGSHDTNRPLFMLDHNAATGTNDAPLEDPNYDWSGPIERLKGVLLLQMTLPGAPTIYYGDEVGLVGPVTYDGSTWQDDPYNRQPFPWLDETGTPFYTHLQTPAGQDAIRDYYKTLTAARNTHAALRTGSFDTLLVDDANSIYAYGRKITDNSDAAIVIVSRAAALQTVTLDLAGYLPFGAQFTNVLDNQSHTVSGTGELTLDIPAESGAVLVLAAPIEDAPDPVTDLTVTTEGDGSLDLGWSAAVGATSYDVYRSLLSGGGYMWITNTASTTYTDPGLTNGVNYYYVVVSVDDTTGLESAYSNEAVGMPHYQIGWANLQWPYTINHTIGLTPTENIYGQVWIDGVTSLPGATPGLLAQVGYGISGTLPIDWTDWTAAGFNGDAVSNDEFAAQLVPEQTGVFHYLYRYSTTGGRDWIYADISGPIDPALAPPDPGVLTVVASADTTAPPTPQNLRVTDWSTDFISLAWDAVTGDPTLYAYDIFRSTISNTVGAKIDRVLAPTTVYTDTNVASGVTYYYNIQAVDSSFNRSGYSNQASGVAEPKLVTVTFRVRVPDYTPPGDTIYIAGDLAAFSSQWNPGADAMTEVAPNIWEITFTIPDGTAGQYKYTRGSWDTVESWGSIAGLANRQVTIDYGTDGTQLVDNTATDWGSGPDDDKAVQDWVDPLVVSHTPAAGATGVPLDTTIAVTWSHTMTLAADFAVAGPAGPVAGSFDVDPSLHVVTFTPTSLLEAGATYTVTIAAQVDSGGRQLQSPVVFTFETIAAVVTPEVSFTMAEYTVQEGVGFATITVVLSAAPTITTTVEYATADGSALEGADYTAVSGVLTFAPGVTSQTFQVPILTDSEWEGPETVVLTLANPVNAVLGDPITATLTIQDLALFFPLLPKDWTP